MPVLLWLLADAVKALSLMRCMLTFDVQDFIAAACESSGMPSAMAQQAAGVAEFILRLFVWKRIAGLVCNQLLAPLLQSITHTPENATDNRLLR